jgi:hypothetical protein
MVVTTPIVHRPEQLAAHARDVIERRREALESVFGWTHLRATVQITPALEHLVVRGEVLVPSVVDWLRSDLEAVLPAGWSLLLHLRVLDGGDWRALPPGLTRLERCLPTALRPAALVTEVLQSDGPVQRLACQDGAALVRTFEGTIGWTTSPLGGIVSAPLRPKVRLQVPAFERALRSYVGTPYLLGGATANGIDCSALVQRGLRDAAGAVVPRHSLDQLRAAEAPARPVGEPGDLVYTWPKSGGPCHVGVVLRGPRRRRRTVVHASATRRRVVEEPLDRFLAQADRVRHVELAQILDARS